MQKTLFLLDGMSLLYRAHFAMSKLPLLTTTGINTSAIKIFFNTLQEVITKQAPHSLAVAFDVKGDTLRHKAFTDYKRNRQTIPEDLVVALRYVKDILTAMRIPILEMPGYEADDVIGTIAKQAAAEQFRVYLMTLDKDFAQLVTPSVQIYRPPANGQPARILDEAAVKKTWGVQPSQVPDLLGLWGDTSDNIPGVPGIGEKTAKALVQEYGSMENIFANLDKITKPALRRSLQENKEQALLSKQLAVIITDLPVNFDERTFAFTKNYDIKALTALFTTLESKGMAKKILGLSAPQPLTKAQSMDTVIRVLDQGHFEELLKAKDLGLAIQTNGPLLDVALSTHNGSAYVLSLNSTLRHEDKYRSFLGRLLANPKAVKIGYDLKKSLKVLQTFGIDLADPLYDPMIIQYLLNSDAPLSERALVQTQLNIHLSDAPSLGERADAALRLKQTFEKDLAHSQPLYALAHDMEFPLIRVLASMETEGIRIDVEALRAYDASLVGDMERLRAEIYALAGEEFNLASPKQVGAVLFGKLLPDLKSTKTTSGQYKTDENTLQSIKSEHLVVEKILEYRTLSKLKSTYVNALQRSIDPATSSIHTTFNQAKVSTGRLSSENPNLQTIPIKSQRGSQLRKIFVSKASESLLLAADYSQIELRILAHIAEEDTMLEAFNKGEDVHRATASKIFNIPMDDVTQQQRAIAKTVNFGIVYGQTPFGLSRTLSIPMREAKEIIEAYFLKYPKIVKYMEEAVKRAQKDGFICTLFGRRNYVRDINSANAVMRGISERKAINSPIQGTASDIIKKAMIEIYNKICAQGLKSRILLQIHDELVLDVLKEEKEVVTNLVLSAMAGVVELKAKLEVHYSLGPSLDKS